MGKFEYVIHHLRELTENMRPWFKDGKPHEGLDLPDNAPEQLEAAAAFLELAAKDRYAWPTIADYENSLGQPVNEAFRIGWDMGRMKESHFEIPVDLKEDSDG